MPSRQSFVYIYSLRLHPVTQSLYYSSFSPRFNTRSHCSYMRTRHISKEPPISVFRLICSFLLLELAVVHKLVTSIDSSHNSIPFFASTSALIWLRSQRLIYQPRGWFSNPSFLTTAATLSVSLVPSRMSVSHAEDIPPSRIEDISVSAHHQPQALEFNAPQKPNGPTDGGRDAWLTIAGWCDLICSHSSVLIAARSFMVQFCTVG